MCGRFALVDTKELNTRFDTQNSVDLEPMYNIAPSFQVPVITRNSPNKVELMKWGRIPYWAKGPKIGYKMINARSEEVSSKASFREPFKKRRCLVPANGFYEWKKLSDKNKQPYYIRYKDNRVFAFAGLYDVWKDAEGKEIRSFTILTTKPNKVVSEIHDRMPVILEKKDEDVWLNQDTEPDQLNLLFSINDHKGLEAYKVSTMVNSPQNQGSELVNAT